VLRGEVEQSDHPLPGGDVRSPAVADLFLQRGEIPVHCGGDVDSDAVDTELVDYQLRVFEALRAGHAIRQPDSDHVLPAQRLDREKCSEGRVDSTGEPDNTLGEATSEHDFIAEKNSPASAGPAPHPFSADQRSPLLARLEEDGTSEAGGVPLLPRRFPFVAGSNLGALLFPLPSSLLPNLLTRCGRTSSRSANSGESARARVMVSGSRSTVMMPSSNSGARATISPEGSITDEPPGNPFPPSNPTRLVCRT